MRSGSITLLSLAALGASLGEGAAIPQDSAGSPSSSRRSSIQSSSGLISPSTTSSSTSTSATSTSSSTFPTSTIISSTAKAAGRPAFGNPFQSGSASTTATSSSIDPLARTSSSSSSILQSSSTLQSVVSSSTRRSSSLLNPTLVTTSLPPSSTSSFSTTRRSSLSPITSSSSTTIPMSRSSSSSSYTSARLTSTTSLAAAGRPTFNAPVAFNGAVIAAAASPSSSSATSTTSVTSSSSTTSSSTSVATTTTKSTSSSTSATTSATTTLKSSSAAVSSKATSTISTSTSSTTSTKSSSVLSKAPSSAVSTKVSSSTVPTKAISSTLKSSSSVPSASATAKAQNAIDFGCWYDTSANRTLTGASYTDSTSMTKESCSAFCTSHNMPFSGTEYGEECYCSETAPTAAAAWWCNMPCTGNSAETCGSGNALSVVYTPPTTVASSSSTALGCYADSSSQRTMTGPSFTSSSMTNEACASFCTVEGYQYSGTEYASQCFCSNEAPWSAPVSCSMACSGDSTEICGDGNALSVTKSGKTSTSATTTSSAATASATSKSITAVDLNQKFSSWSTWKARGVNLGNWLVLEQWMYPTWFDNTAPGAVDEWTFCQSLGKAACTTALQQHWSTFITESDIASMAGMKANTLRIPIGFWAFIDPIASEPYIRSTQLTELSRVLGYAQKYSMTVVLDIHGLPGSQNGKDHSGHLGSVDFYTATNQARSLAAVQAAATWIASSGYAGTTLSALEVANEPAIADWTTWLAYKDYVMAAHTIVQTTVPSVTTMFHDGFWPLAPWNQFFKEGDNAVIDTHKYWAFSETSLEQASKDVCAYVDQFAAINIPVFVGEFSLSIQADVSSFVGYAVGFFESQMSVWLKAAGAAFWSVKVIQDDGSQNAAWSAEGILQSGVFDNIDVWQFDQAVC